MDPAVARALSLVQYQIKTLEKRVSELCLPEDAVEDALPGRYANMFADVDIDSKVIEENPLLVNLYQSETLKLTSQCVGTWPNDNMAGNALCIFGGDTLQSGHPCEIVRQTIIPELIKHQVPFSCTQVDSSEGVTMLQLCTLFKSAPSHLILDAEMSFNFSNMILEAYLLGRGHGGIYKITRAPPKSTQKTVNLIEAETDITNTERYFECTKLLAIMSPTAAAETPPSPRRSLYNAFAGTSESFFDVILNVTPDVIQQHFPQTVATRRAYWNDVCEETITTDMGILVAAAYMAGMLSPRARGKYTPVPKSAIGRANEWCGKINMYCKLADVMRPTETDDPTNEQRDALTFFAALLGADMQSE